MPVQRAAPRIINQCRNHVHKEVRRWHEIGVEDGDVFAMSVLQTVGKRTCFEALAIRSADVLDVNALRL
ncbi:MAG: hypothetical protein U0528_16185 [Anaerolineae bacterium]